MRRLIQIMIECGASSASAIKYDDCDIINPRLSEKIPFTPKSVFIGTIPYYTLFATSTKQFHRMLWLMTIIHTSKISAKQ